MRNRDKLELPPDVQQKADWAAARRTIGSTAMHKLTWVVRFIREDPALWHSSAQAEYADCLYALTGGHAWDRGLEAPPIDSAAVVTIHRELKRILEDAVRGPSRTIVFELGPVNVELARVSAESFKPAGWVWAYTGDPRTMVLRRVLDLIGSAGERLIACKFEGCKRPVMANRKQEYCDAACSQFARNERKAQQRERATKEKARRSRGKKTRKG